MNLNEHLIDRIRDAFEELNVLPSIVDEVEDYLEGEIDENEFLNSLPEINFFKIKKLIKCEKAGESLRIHENLNYLRKYFNALYKMGKESIHVILSQYLHVNRDKNINRLLKCGIDKDKILSIYLESVAYNLSYIRNSNFKKLYLLCENERDLIIKAIENLSNDTYIEANSICIIKSIYCNSKVPHDERYLEYLKYVEDDFLSSIGNVYNTLPKDFIDRIINFVKGKEEFESNECITLINILKGYRYDEYLFKFLIGLSSLNIDKSIILKRLVKLFGRVDAKNTFDAAYNMLPVSTFYCETVKNLDKILEISPEYYIAWYAESFGEKKFAYEVLKEKFEQNKEAFEKAIKLCEPSTANLLSSFFLNEGDKEKYIKNIEENCIKIFSEILTCLNLPQDKLILCQSFLRGEKSFNECKELLSSMKLSVNRYWGSRRELIKVLKFLSKCGDVEIYDRCILLLATINEYDCLWELSLIDNVSYDKYNCDDDKIRYIFNLLDENGVNIETQILLVDGIISSYDYWGNKKKAMNLIINNMIASKKEEFAKGIKVASVEGRCIFLSSIFAIESEENAKILISYFGDTSKLVKEKLIELFNDKYKYYYLIKEKLSSKKQGEREVAIKILSSWLKLEDLNNDKKEEIISELNNTLEREKSQKIREIIMKELNKGEDDGELSNEDLVKNLLKGNKKNSLNWLELETLSKVRLKGQEEYCSEEYLKAILLCYLSQSSIEISSDGNKLASQLEKNDLEILANEVFDKWLEKGAEVKKKWVLAFSSIYGGEEIVSRLNTNIKEWAKNSRGAIASEAVRALALNGSSTALLIVDGISRKFKFKQVKAAAGSALTFAAEQMGLSREELSDKIVPTLGFNINGERIFDYGGRSFKVILTPNLQLEVYDENEKKLKNLPAPGKKDNEEIAKASYKEYKDFKKQLKTTMQVQATRLDLALSSERKWSKEAWVNLFVNNPLMHNFAIGLIWGVYKDNNLEETFRYMEDGTFNTKDEDEFEMPEVCEIGLVHPLELTSEDIELWKEQLENYEINQPIEQIERKIFSITNEEFDLKACERFGGKIINGLSLSGKLLDAGWYRGSVQDAGGYYELYKEDKELGIGAELNFEGLFVGYENEDTTVKLLKFYKAGSVKRGSYIYDTIKEDDLLPLGKVPKKFFSEILYQIDKVLSYSTGIDENWKNK